MKFLTLIIVLLIPGIIQAAELVSATRSTGKLLNDNSVELTSKLSTTAIIHSSQSKERGNEIAIEPTTTQQYRLTNDGIVVEFEIFDAWVELSGDLNSDGYFHRITTTFDADVNTPVETVYAKVYLSYEGGPWQQVASSDLFEIRYDSQQDTYEIISELIEGYPPGYYDVLIDLHSFYHEGIVASRIITLDDEGFALTLEDLQHDESFRDGGVNEPVHFVSAGSFSWVGLIMLGFLLMIKVRYFSTVRTATENN